MNAGDITWEVSLTVPAGTAAGNYEIRARCVFPILLGQEPQFGETNYQPQPFTVTGQPSPPTDPAEPVESEVTFTG